MYVHVREFWILTASWIRGSTVCLVDQVNIGMNDGDNQQWYPPFHHNSYMHYWNTLNCGTFTKEILTLWMYTSWKNRNQSQMFRPLIVVIISGKYRATNQWSKHLALIIIVHQVSYSFFWLVYIQRIRIYLANQDCFQRVPLHTCIQ